MVESKRVGEPEVGKGGERERGRRRNVWEERKGAKGR